MYFLKARILLCGVIVSAISLPSHSTSVTYHVFPKKLSASGIGVETQSEYEQRIGTICGDFDNSLNRSVFGSIDSVPVQYQHLAALDSQVQAIRTISLDSKNFISQTAYSTMGRIRTMENGLYESMRMRDFMLDQYSGSDRAPDALSTADDGIQAQIEQIGEAAYNASTDMYSQLYHDAAITTCSSSGSVCETVPSGIENLTGCRSFWMSQGNYFDYGISDYDSNARRFGYKKIAVEALSKDNMDSPSASVSLNVDMNTGASKNRVTGLVSFKGEEKSTLTTADAFNQIQQKNNYLESSGITSSQRAAMWSGESIYTPPIEINSGNASNDGEAPEPDGWTGEIDWGGEPMSTSYTSNYSFEQEVEATTSTVNTSSSDTDDTSVVGEQNAFEANPNWFE